VSRHQFDVQQWRVEESKADPVQNLNEIWKTSENARLNTDLEREKRASMGFNLP
jgi:hypothetical protein